MNICVTGEEIIIFIYSPTTYCFDSDLGWPVQGRIWELYKNSFQYINILTLIISERNLLSISQILSTAYRTIGTS